MFGLQIRTLVLIGKVACGVVVIGLLVNKGMMLERARWERALVAKNAEIAKVNADAEQRLQEAETKRDAALVTASAALEAAKLSEELLPAELVKKANDIR